MNFNFIDMACGIIKDIIDDTKKPSTVIEVPQPKIDINVNVYINIYTSGLGNRTKSMVGENYIDQY